MGHLHVVTDRDNYFVIDPVTRQLSNNSNKITLMKTDHNSERFTFELPLFIEDHDMSKCNKVEVHYINIDSQTRKQSAGVYMVEDFKVNPDNSETVIGSWLISRNVTMYAGTLSFVLRLACVTGEVVDYSWSSAIYNGITVSDGICNTEVVVAEYSDILNQWLSKLEQAASGSTYLITDDGAFIDLTDKLETLEQDNQYFHEMETDLRNTIDQINTTSDISRIDTEIANLKNADTNLSNRIDNLVQSYDVVTINSKITTLQNEDKSIKTNIANLQAADTALNKRIDDIDKSAVISGMATEIANLKTADTNLSNRIDNIDQSAVISGMATEIANLKTADTEFDSRITAIAQINSELYNITEGIENEIEVLNTLVAPLGTIIQTTNPFVLGILDETLPNDKFIYIGKETKTKNFTVKCHYDAILDEGIIGRATIGFGISPSDIVCKSIYEYDGWNGGGSTLNDATADISYDYQTGVVTVTVGGQAQTNMTYDVTLETPFTIYTFERIA